MQAHEVRSAAAIVRLAELEVAGFVLSVNNGKKNTLVSICLSGNPTNQSGDIVDYNEHYNFGILQGRLGFGSQGKYYVLLH